MGLGIGGSIWLRCFFLWVFIGSHWDCSNCWTVNSASRVALAVPQQGYRLQTEQPKTLDVYIPSDVPTHLALGQLCRGIQQRFTGTLKLQLWSLYMKYEDCSGMINALSGSRWRSCIMFTIYVFLMQKCDFWLFHGSVNIEYFMAITIHSRKI